jgi:predicted hydrolase (HD superfamily)
MNRAKIAIDITGLAGAAALVEGARQVYTPAAWIVAGLLALAFAVGLARDVARRSETEAKP